LVLEAEKHDLLVAIPRGEQNTNMLESRSVARRPDRENADILSEKDLKELRRNLAHLSIQAVRDFYDQAYRDCRLVYNRLPSPRQMQTLVQVWKQLWKCRRQWAPPNERQNFAVVVSMAAEEPRLYRLLQERVRPAVRIRARA